MACLAFRFNPPDPCVFISPVPARLWHSEGCFLLASTHRAAHLLPLPATPSTPSPQGPDTHPRPCPAPHSGRQLAIAPGALADLSATPPSPTAGPCTDPSGTPLSRHPGGKGAVARPGPAARLPAAMATPPAGCILTD